jgi:hypothetical protein
MAMLKRWFVLLPFCLLVSCGDFFIADSNHQKGEPQLEDNALPDFSTRLTNDLLVSGDQCQGGETTDSEGEVFVCESTQWLITVDNINTCTPEGCTEVAVVPTIGILEPVSTQEDFQYFDIRASIPVSAAVEAILERVTVRFGGNEAPQVLFK